MSSAPEWASRSGDAWAARWRDTDRGLAELSPELHAALLGAAPAGPFRALEVGCGPGSTTIDLALARPDAAIVACDLSPSLVYVARDRLRSITTVEVELGDARDVAIARGPFDLIYSRHGVMFFVDPVVAFRELRGAASDGAGLVFSCFQSWDSNLWASELASAAAGKPLPPPRREPSGFAFADPDYVRDILQSAGWTCAEAQPVSFTYVAAEGEQAAAEALSFLCDIGPASRVTSELGGLERQRAVERMERVIQNHLSGAKVEFDAAAWIWTARAGREAR